MSTPTSSQSAVGLPEPWHSTVYNSLASQDRKHLHLWLVYFVCFGGLPKVSTVLGIPLDELDTLRRQA